MTVSTATSFNSYAGNGSTTSFAYAFKIFQDSNLVVTLVNDTTGVETTQTLTTDYTVTGAGSDSGGSVVFGTAPALGNTVVIRRVLPVTQETNYVPNDPFPAEAHEDALDKLTMLVQQEVASSELAVQFPEGDVGSGINNILPSVTGRSDKLLKFGLDGGVEVIAASDLSNAIIGANYSVDTFTGTGSTTVYTLSSEPGSKANAAIYIDGVYQAKANYSVSGSTLTFTTAPPLNSAIEIVIGDAIPAGAATTASAVSYTQGGAGAVTTNVQAKLRETVSVKDFGAVGDGVADDYTAIAACWTHCLANAVGMYFPSGTYRVNDLNFPMGRINGLAPSSLLDCKNVTIFGDGRSTILKTVSSAGADVLQFNGAKNLHVKDLSITADLTGSAGAGSNCVSLTGGADNITFENVYAFNPDYVEKVAYLDGGKGFTIQMTSITPERGTITFTNCIADGCVYGFDINPTIDDILSKKTVTRIDACIAENCWYGFIASTPAATASVPSGFDQGIVIDGTAINCQHTFTLGRVHGGDYSISVVNSKSKANLKLDPSGSAWSASLNTTVDVFTATYAYNALISITGYAANVDNKAQVGGTTGGTVTGYTFQSKMYIDIGGTSDVSDFTVVDSGGNSINNCDVYVTNRTTSSALPAALYTSANENTVTKGSQKKFHDPLVDGPLGFVYTDGITTHNTIERDGLGLFAKQVGGSSNDIAVFGVKDNTGNKDFVVFNNGGIYSASAATATSAATIKKVLIFYDSAGAIDGYIPIYTSYS